MNILAARKLTTCYAISTLIAALMAGASLAGLFFQSSLYSSEALRGAFVANDVVNLFVGLPILLGSMWLTRRGDLIGVLFWPGALLYVAYNYSAYAVAMPLTVQFVVYAALVISSVYVILRLIASIDGAEVQQRLRGRVPERFSGGVLIGLGTLFFLRSIAQAASALSGQAGLARPDLGVVVADLLTTPVWVFGGVLLWRRKAFGYISGAGLLFQASMSFAGLLVFFILQPFLTAIAFPVADFAVVFVMGLICFVPFGLFVRGMLSNKS